MMSRNAMQPGASDNTSKKPGFFGKAGLLKSLRRSFAPSLVLGSMAVIAVAAWAQGPAVQGIRKNIEKLEENVSKKKQGPAEKKAPPAKKESPKATKRDRPESRKSKKKDETADEPEATGKQESAKSTATVNGPDISTIPLLSEMETPTLHQLLQEPPVDWIVLKQDERVIVSGLVYPRPDTLKKMEAALDQKVKSTRPKDDAEREKLRQEKEDLAKLNVFLPSEKEHPEYRIDVKYVDRIIYHEDLMLKRIDKLMKEGVNDVQKMRDAFEMLNGLERRVPDWPGVRDVQNRLLFYEALYRLQKKEPEAALVYLEDLYAVAPKFPALTKKLGEVADQLISAGFQAEDYRRARHFISRLRAIDAQHPVVLRWDQAFEAKAIALLKQALAESQAGRHDTAAQMVKVAAGIWPRAAGLQAAHAALTTRYQTLNVGVVELPGEPSAYFLPTDADLRAHYLTQPWLFEVADVREKAIFRTSYFEEWEPLDLGRRARFTLRQTRSYWESQPVATANRVVSWLSARLNPDSPLYDERFAGYVKSMKVRAPFEFEIEFARVPLVVEGLLLAPPAEGHLAESHGAASAGADSDDDMLYGRFQLHERSENRVSYRRTQPEPEGAPVYHVAEIDEIKHQSYGLAVQGLLRGEIDVLPHVRSWDVPRFQSDDRFVVQQYAVPVTHLIQVNPRSKALANRELRRALEYALDRESVLKNIILKEPDPKGERGRLVSAPYRKASLAYDGLVDLPAADLTLAFALAAAARKQSKDTMPKLTMLCVPDPIAEEAAKEIVRRWNKVGFDVELVAGPGASPAPAEPKWDIIYRTVRVAEPALELWTLLTLEPYARVRDVHHLSDQLRIELLGLESAPDSSAANAILRRLHARLLAEVQFIPLWEVDDYIVFRKAGVGNFHTRPFYTYQDIEQWTTRAWYPPDEP